MIFYWQNLIEKNKEHNDNGEKIINIGVLYIFLCSMIWGEMWLLFLLILVELLTNHC